MFVYGTPLVLVLVEIAIPYNGYCSHFLLVELAILYLQHLLTVIVIVRQRSIRYCTCSGGFKRKEATMPRQAFVVVVVVVVVVNAFDEAKM